MRNLTPIAFVIDRRTAPRVARDVMELRGAWREMFRAWQRSDAEFLILLAHTPERLRRRAPLTAMTSGADGLRAALRLMFEQLAEVKCRWFLFVERGTDADDIVRAELLLDATPGGIA